jgi:hypothetical protein
MAYSGSSLPLPILPFSRAKRRRFAKRFVKNTNSYRGATIEVKLELESFLEEPEPC